MLRQRKGAATDDEGGSGGACEAPVEVSQTLETKVIASPASAPNEAETPKQMPALLDMMTVPPQIFDLSAIHDEKSNVETAPKAKTPSVAKKPPSIPMARPANATPAKKRLDYEE
jgi:hypothetical protein